MLKHYEKSLERTISNSIRWRKRWACLFGTRLTDVETCYQVFRREAVLDMALQNNHFAFTVELAVKLIKRGYRIQEIPIQYVPRGRRDGKKIYWGDGFASLYTLVKYRFWD
jgi:hypothetical protein